MKTDSDFDLAAIRGLRAEPTDESLTRTWYRITKKEAAKSRRSRSRVLVPVAVAALVVAMVGASPFVYSAGSGVLWPVASTPDTISTLNILADKAATGVPVSVSPGQVIRSDTDGLAGECSSTSCTIVPQDNVRWYDVHAGAYINLPTGAREASAQPQGDELQPGIRRPTLEWLASLPTDQDELLKRLRTEVGQHDRWTVDGQLWDAMEQLYAYCELALTPQQRAAFLRAFTGMTGLTTRQITADGRALIAIRHTDDTRAQEILFDPETGSAVGRASYYLGPDLTITNPFEPGGMSRSVWTQKVEPRP